MIHASLLLLAAATSFPPASASRFRPTSRRHGAKPARRSDGFRSTRSVAENGTSSSTNPATRGFSWAFLFQMMPTKDLASLPVPNVPFGVWNDTGHATDAHVKDLVRFAKLRALNLSHSRITDAGVADLARLDDLVWLNLDSTAFPRAASRTSQGSRSSKR